MKEDRDNSAYAPYGNAIHNTLEKYYNQKISYEKMSTEFEDILFTLTLSGVKFDRTDTEKNKNIQTKYIFNLRHFFKTHKTIPFKVITEQFIVAKIGEHVFQGYMDAIYKDNHGNHVIIDFKSSTIYKGEKVLKEGKQLILYAEALRQMGIPLNKIKICWNFLKYCNVTVEQANGKTSTRQIERCKIGESLQSHCKMWLKKLGYEDEMESYLESLLMTNDIYGLPEDVQRKYHFDDCYVYIPLSEDIIENLKTEITDTIHEIKEKERIFNDTKDDKAFWEDEDRVEKQSYYFAVLCGYSGFLHKPYGAWLQKLKQEKEQNNSMFGAVGKTENENEFNEFAWLNEL